jgi:two-component system LytT family response regulator
MCALASLKAINTVIVDDEPVAIERLQNELQAFPQINITGTASDGQSAIALIDSTCPDLVFLDIQMPEIGGFDVVNQITHRPLVVFVTAYDEYAVAAFEKNSLDYLLKPVASERLALTIQRTIDRRNEQTDVFSKIQELIKGEEKKAYITTIPVKSGHRIVLIQVSDICFFEAKDKYVYLHTHDDEKLLDNSLSYLEDRLPPEFIRIHRSYIINKHKIQEIQKYFKGGFIFILNNKDKTRIKSAASFSEAIKTRLLLL